MGLRSKITDSFWFLPLAMGVLGIIFAWTMVWIDHFLINNAIDIKIADVGAEGGRGILTAIAGSILGVAATSFSITTSVLATASSTYGPRLVRNFMADSRNQFVLGSFVASFLYALMVLRTVRDVGDIGTAFVPNLAISVAIIMAIVNVVLLIYFIHHIADSIQISTLVSRVRDDLIHCIDALYPLAKNDDDDNIPRDRFTEELPNEPPIVVHSQSDGFITWIDYEKLVSEAEQQNEHIKLLVQPGDYVHYDMPLANVWTMGGNVSGREFSWIAYQVHIEQTRTPYQDIRYAVQQPVDITIRALSPGLNDPYTAINALRGLGSGLTRLAIRSNAPAVLFDERTIPRVHQKNIAIEHMLDSAFRTLRSNVTRSLDATMAVLELAENILTVARHDSYKQVVMRAIEHTRDAFLESSAPEVDKQIVASASEQILGRYQNVLD